ncbi:hypothetical protein BC831DRAFT_451390 [Entophlyctis helioformis]|nr:hypothetical protein BC831DRAFT_451390 [Entophlyctis helioformis]
MQSQQAIAIAEVAVSRGASPGSDEFRIRVVRGASAHTIVRSTADLVSLHRSMMLSYAASSLPEFPLSMTSSTSSSLSVTSPTHAGSALADDMATKAQRTDLYLNALASHSWTRSATDRRLPASLATFFQPRNGKESELSAYTGSIRRDSGFSDPSSGVHATQVKQPASALTASSSSIMNNRAPIAPARSHPNLKDVCPWTEQAVVPQPQPHQQHQFQINMGLSSKPASFQQQQQQLQPSSNTSTRKRSVASEFFSHLFGSSTSTSTSTSSHTTSAF